MRKAINPVGINLVTKEVEEDERLVIWQDNSKKKFSTQKQTKENNLWTHDSQILEFEEKVIRPEISTMDSTRSICPECSHLLLVPIDGCMCVIPVTDTTGIESLDLLERGEIIDLSMFAIKFTKYQITTERFEGISLRGSNRDRVLDRLPVGQNGRVKYTSPHKISSELRSKKDSLQKVEQSKRIRSKRVTIGKLKEKL